MKDRIIELLKSTGRENIDKVIEWMSNNGFFEAPASVVHHNNFEGGLMKHSLEVYEEAVKLNDSLQAPFSRNSIIICALLHDICKSDQYFIGADGKPHSDRSKISRGHGRRSMFIVKKACQVPLSYDEEMAIWWHMGIHEASIDRFPSEFTDSKSVGLCELIQKADGIAARK